MMMTEEDNEAGDTLSKKERGERLVAAGAPRRTRRVYGNEFARAATTPRPRKDNINSSNNNNNNSGRCYHYGATTTASPRGKGPALYGSSSSSSRGGGSTASATSSRQDPSLPLRALVGVGTLVVLTFGLVLLQHARCSPEFRVGGGSLDAATHRQQGDHRDTETTGGGGGTWRLMEVG